MVNDLIATVDREKGQIRAIRDPGAFRKAPRDDTSRERPAKLI